ncbi:MAG: 50S ribosomal protein L25 [Candidatus Staskawiczbacteria bacterium]|nr:50S ribosomal protein L25 [Candidatus Staskawiczbacteria bacterium]MBI3337507.1 50S ribosomal protein L25 [Candidatus Staskawiczbacteria bacterium]
MISLEAKIRTDFGKKNLPAGRQAKSLKELRRQDKIPAVVYGPGVKNASIVINYKDFQKVFRQAGESSLIELNIDGESKKRPVLINETQKDPVSDKFIHVDFFQASLKEEVEATVPLVFFGTALAEKDLGGTLVKNITEVQVKALPQNLPHEIKVSITGLLNFDDHILIKDLVLPESVKILKKPDEIVASVVEQQKIEEELKKPIEEDVESVEKIEKEKKTEEVVEEVQEQEKETK